jgi:hypothetical protein
MNSCYASCILPRLILEWDSGVWDWQMAVRGNSTYQVPAARSDEGGRGMGGLRDVDILV